MFKHLGRFTANRPWLVCSVWLVFGILAAVIAPKWDTRAQDDDIRFVPDRFSSVRAYQLLEKAFPKDVHASNLIFAIEREQGTLRPADFALVDKVRQDLEQLRQDEPELKIGKIETYASKIIGPRLPSPDRQSTLVKHDMGAPNLAMRTENAVKRSKQVVAQRMAETGDDSLKHYATGMAGIGRDLVTACGKSLDNTTWATIILVIVILLAVYRAPLLALIPLVSIAASVWVSLNLLALMTLIPGVHLVNISKIFAVVILYGAGTDYCLFLVSRYREELEKGRDGQQAIRASVGGVGEALAASAGTVMVGLGLMAFAEFAKVRYSGPAIALRLGVALLAALTLTPALLRLFGKAAFWPKPAPSPPKLRLLRRLNYERLGLWDWISHRVAANPVAIWLVSIAILMPLVVIGAQITPTYEATAQLSPREESLRGLATIKKHFNPGEVGPMTVLLASKTDWRSRAGQVEIDHLSRGFARLDNVAEVRSLTQPLGLRLPQVPPADPSKDDFWARVFRELGPIVNLVREHMLRKSSEHYVAAIGGDTSADDSEEASAEAERYVTRLDIILKTDPFEPKSAETLSTIKTWLWKELPRSTLLKDEIQAEVFGATANSKDLETLTSGDRLRVNALVLVAIFLILLALVRKPIFALYLLATVLLSYFAALGATVLAGSLWTGELLWAVDWRVPFFLFTILVAVGEDYNIFLASRALEEEKRYGAREGMRRALARTGGPITSCGLIMAGTFATLMLAGLNTLMQVGFALAFGVLLDTFVVRPFLVPAFAMFWWKQKSDPQAWKDADTLGKKTSIASRARAA